MGTKWVTGWGAVWPGPCKLTSLWKETQAETLSTGSSTTTQHSRGSCLILLIHTDTGTLSLLRLTTSTCGQRPAAPATPSHKALPTPGTRHFRPLLTGLTFWK